MKKILVAIDFSECSINALEHAITIARKADAGIEMIFVIRPDSSREMFTEGPQTMSAMVKDKFDELVEKYQPLMGKNKLEYLIKEGKVYHEIVKEADKKEIFLVMAGTHGSSGFEEFWMGSNANRIVSAIKKPVITIRGGVSINRHLEKIILPLDSTPETRQKVPFTAYMARIFDAEVHVLRVYTSSVKAVIRKVDSYAEQVVKHLEEDNIKYVLESVEADNISDSTIEYALKVNANLISIMTEQETAAKNLLLGPYAQQMVNHSPIPVLSIHPKELLVALSR
ncbi:MAG TPA: universal stress protein [Bacteroidales bacterium]|nr:universal stress protein [Bacteroidales bacterium]HOX77549.1 universal stress protein [Bacteroidales bacterium]HPI85397.1 universal stress protein [Bacteroidales bacterium]HPM93313.1 universal stress protein [Bacteroidales bacterium]